MVNLNPAVAALRLAVVKDAIESDASPGEMLVYGDDYPSTSSLMATFVLADPVGSIVDLELLLSAIDPVMPVLAGTPKWARITDGAGGWVVDLGAGGPTSDQPVKLSSVNVVLGVPLEVVGTPKISEAS